MSPLLKRLAFNFNYLVNVIGYTYLSSCKSCFLIPTYPASACSGDVLLGLKDRSIPFRPARASRDDCFGVLSLISIRPTPCLW